MDWRTRNRYTSDPRRIDERTRLACKTVKDADVRVHTIRVIEGNARLLRACASAPETYHEVSRASELTAVFRKIVGDITNIRLAR